MAKTKTSKPSEEVEVIEPDTKAADEKNKGTKKAKANDKNVKQKKKPAKEKKSIKKKFSEMWSELKKVSRPSFGKVVKNTCVVIAVVVICTVVLFGVDKLFSLVYDLLLPNS